MVLLPALILFLCFSFYLLMNIPLNIWGSRFWNFVSRKCHFCCNSCFASVNSCWYRKSFVKFDHCSLRTSFTEWLSNQEPNVADSVSPSLTPQSIMNVSISHLELSLLLSVTILKILPDTPTILMHNCFSSQSIKSLPNSMNKMNNPSRGLLFWKSALPNPNSIQRASSLYSMPSILIWIANFQVPCLLTLKVNW